MFRQARLRAAAVGLAAAIAAGATAPTALAHGIGGDATDKSVIEFVPLGVEHMLLGWDHLLFIVGVVVLAAGLRRAAKLISLFVAGHSLTLLVATLAGWQLSATLVDIVIALSLAYVGAHGLQLYRPSREAPGRAIFVRGGRNAGVNWGPVAGAVFAFGLVHGLGLSTRLQHLGLPEDGLVWRVIAFNVGVEIGQLVAILVIVGLGSLIVRAVNRPVARRGAFVALIATGVIAAATLALTAGEQVVAAPDAGQEEAVIAVTAYRRLACGRLAKAALASFTEQWFADVQAGRFR